MPMHRFVIASVMLAALIGCQFGTPIPTEVLYRTNGQASPSPKPSPLGSKGFPSPKILSPLPSASPSA